MRGENFQEIAEAVRMMKTSLVEATFVELAKDSRRSSRRKRWYIHRIDLERERSRERVTAVQEISEKNRRERTDRV